MKCLLSRCHFENCRSQATVEFALLLPILALVMIGSIEFAQLYDRNIRVANAARDGARVAATGKTPTEITTHVNASVDNVLCGVTMSYSSSSAFSSATTLGSSGGQNNAPVGNYIRVTVMSTNQSVSGIFPIIKTYVFSNTAIVRRE